jgi:hypothetical protein
MMTKLRNENLYAARKLTLRRNVQLLILSLIALYLFSNTKGWVSDISAGFAVVTIHALLAQFERFVEIVLDIEDMER